MGRGSPPSGKWPIFFAAGLAIAIAVSAFLTAHQDPASSDGSRIVPLFAAAGPECPGDLILAPQASVYRPVELNPQILVP